MQQLQHFALGDPVGGIGKDRLHLHRFQLDHQLEAARIQEVADQHAGRVAPDRVGGFTATAQVGLVDHVIVKQGRGVDELDHRGQLVRIRAAVVERAGRQQQQHRSQALAPRIDDVFRHLVDQHHVGCQTAPDQRIDGRHVLTRQRLDLAEVGGGAQWSGSVHGKPDSRGRQIIGVPRRAEIRCAYRACTDRGREEGRYTCMHVAAGDQKGPHSWLVASTR